jgi:RNA 3'-terminal phosphate cyclase (GTP)
MIEIPGDYLEGGGQILRTASCLSCITGKPIKVFNIRAKRPNPGLSYQHLYTLKALAGLFKAESKGLELKSKEISFFPKEDFIQEKTFDIDLKTAGAIGLALQPLILVSAFKGKGICFNIKGGTCGLGAIPIDYYKNVIFPILARFGLKADLEIVKRGYYPEGGGEVKVKIEPLREPKGIDLLDAGKIIRIEVISIASKELASRNVSQRQAETAQELLKKNFSVPIGIKIDYTRTLSIGSEMNLIAYTENSILGADSRGERNKTAERVGEEAAEKLIKEIHSGAACDLHLADNLIPWLALLGGRIKTSVISLHTQTNVWICELFFGKIFTVEGNTISCAR